MNEPKTPVQLWVEALRSGEFKQTQGALHNLGGYCCLGVACEVYKKQFPKFPVAFIKTCNEWVYGDEQAGEDLPQEVCDWLGLNSVRGDYGCRSLVHHNDSDADSFAEIADIIESRPPGLFMEESV